METTTAATTTAAARLGGDFARNAREIAARGGYLVVRNGAGPDTRYFAQDGSFGPKGAAHRFSTHGDATATVAALVEHGGWFDGDIGVCA